MVLNREKADFADLHRFILWWNWVFFSRKQISENQRNLFYQCSYRQRKWNTEEADFGDLHGFASGKPKNTKGKMNNHPPLSIWLTDQGSNLDFSESKSDVLPVTPSVNPNLAVQI